MAKKETDTTATTTAIPDPIVDPVPELTPAPIPANLTQAQQKVAGFVRAAEKDAPGASDITEIIENDARIAMAVPQGVRRQEFDYAWLSIEDIERDLFSHGGKWVLVTRSNHSHVPDSFFGMDGAITYRGQNILGFCKREVTEAIEKRISDSFNQKSRSAKNKFANHQGIIVEETDGRDAGRIIGNEALATDADYDFDAT